MYRFSQENLGKDKGRCQKMDPETHYSNTCGLKNEQSGG